MGSSALVSNLVTAHIIIIIVMNFKFLFVFCFCLIGFSMAVPMPWVRADFADIKTREVDIESPLSAHPSDPTVYYLYRFPMSCGELCFNGSGCGNVKKKRPNKKC